MNITESSFQPTEKCRLPGPGAQPPLSGVDEERPADGAHRGSRCLQCGWTTTVQDQEMLDGWGMENQAPAAGVRCLLFTQHCQVSSPSLKAGHRGSARLSHEPPQAAATRSTTVPLLLPGQLPCKGCRAALSPPEQVAPWPGPDVSPVSDCPR